VANTATDARAYPRNLRSREWQEPVTQQSPFSDNISREIATHFATATVLLFFYWSVSLLLSEQHSSQGR
jgi:hypothetical protein